MKHTRYAQYEHHLNSITVPGCTGMFT